MRMVVIIPYSHYNGADLLYIIPEIYELQPENSTIYIISPWLNLTIDLIQPWNLKTIKFINLIKSKMDIGIKTEAYISSMSNKEYNTQESIKLMDDNSIKYEIINELHSKAIIGQYIAYKGSANITYSGLHENKETAGLYEVSDPVSELRSII